VLRRRLLGVLAAALTCASAPASSPAENANILAQSRLEKCVRCCAEYQKTCDPRTDPHCEEKHTKCVAHCNRQGNMPSDWNCWWRIGAWPPAERRLSLRRD
jgi:hypothetical protein